jgi:hypothetical protein
MHAFVLGVKEYTGCVATCDGVRAYVFLQRPQIALLTLLPGWTFQPADIMHVAVATQ